MNNLHVKTGDNVMIISGKDKGHTGKVLQVSPSENKVIVEGQNMVTKHVKPRRQGEQGGIVKAEGAMYASKVMPICPKCGKAVRVGHVEKDGKMVRVCKKCAERLRCSSLSTDYRPRLRAKYISTGKTYRKRTKLFYAAISAMSSRESDCFLT